MNVRRKKYVKPAFANSVFVNCPFDDDYKPLFRALVFAIQDCGYGARCALEVDDSGEARADKIIRLIKESQFGIHDICRTEVNSLALPRFNMPFELGIFVGFKYSGDARQQRKRLLILDRDRYRYQQFISDIAGQDIRSHNGDANDVIRQVRHWLQNQTTRTIPGADRLIRRFSEFQMQVPLLLAQLHKTEADLDNYYDLHNLISDWIDLNSLP